MKRLGQQLKLKAQFVVTLALFGSFSAFLSTTTEAAADARVDNGIANGADEALSTERRVHGVITSVAPASLTIASTQRAVTGKIDPARTKVRVNGKPGTVGDLKLSARAKGELCLDDVWLAIDLH